jgi:HSP20 family molecular chaperone IbpA
MERTVEEAIVRAKTVYEWVTGQPAPEASVEAPYARIPPEVDREEHVIRQAASLLEKVQELTQSAQGVRAPVQSTVAPSWVAPVVPAPFAVSTGRDEVRYVFELAGVPKDRISVELQSGTLRIVGDRPAVSVDGDNRLASSETPKIRFERFIRIPLPVEPKMITASFADGLLTVRVRVPSADDKVHKIEVR